MNVGVAANASQNFILAGGGTVDEVRLYNRALSAAEVASLYRFPGGVEPGVVDGAWMLDASIQADSIAAGSISTLKLATDAIKSLNYTAGVAGSFFDLSNGEFKSYDDSGTITRSLEFGPGLGLLAKDENDVVFHDIPTANISTGYQYAGHLILLDNSAALELYNGSITTNTWTEMTCITAGNSNAKAAVLQIEASISDSYGATGSFAQWVAAMITGGFRPKDSGWSWTTDANIPKFGFSAATSTTFDAYSFFAADLTQIVVPFGTGNKIEAYIKGNSGDASANIFVHQIGVYV